MVGSACAVQAQLGCLLRRCAALHRFPGRKEENWWLVVGDPKGNSLLAIKRQALQKKGRAKLDITAPSQPGTHHLTLFFMCDSYMGCDQVRLPSLLRSCIARMLCICGHHSAANGVITRATPKRPCCMQCHRCLQPCHLDSSAWGRTEPWARGTL